MNSFGEMIEWKMQLNGLLNNSIYLIKQDEYPHNKWNFNKDIVNINPFINQTFITPIRPILYSRNIFTLNIENFFCNDCYILDDYIAYLNYIDNTLNKNMNTLIINSDGLYLYNNLNNNSVSIKYKEKFDSDYDTILDYYDEFKHLDKQLGKEWDLSKLKYKQLSLPYNETLNIIRIAAKNSKIVGADINELSPIKGFNSYNFLVAKLAYKILSYKFLY